MTSETKYSPLSVTLCVVARCTPSTSTFTVPSGSFSICRIDETQPTSNMSSGLGSSLPAAFCATSMIWRPGLHRDLERLDRLGTADEQRNDHVREDDDVAQRQQRQRDRLGRQNGMTGHGDLSFSADVRLETAIKRGGAEAGAGKKPA